MDTTDTDTNYRFYGHRQKHRHGADMDTDMNMDMDMNKNIVSKFQESQKSMKSNSRVLHWTGGQKLRDHCE